MFLIKIIRWVFGTVTFVVTGAFYERLINLSLKHNIPLWDVFSDSKTMRATTYASKYKKLRPLAKQSKVKIRVYKKYGFPFLRFRYRKRYGILIGLILSVTLIIFSSTRIWNISITGCTTISPSEIKEQLYDLGLRYGIASSSIDSDFLERKIMILNDDIAWIAINIAFSSVDIQVNEQVRPPDQVNPSDRVANIVASADGQIKYMEVYNGQSLVKANEVVSKGDIIVSGIMEDGQLNTRAVFARAKVIAQVYVELSSSVNLSQNQLVSDGETYIEKHFIWGDTKIPLSFPTISNSELFVRDSFNKVISKNPSIILQTTFVTPQKEVQVTLTELEAKELAMKDISEQEDLLEIVKIISRDRENYIKDGVYVLNDKLIIEVDIAETSEILFYPRQIDKNVVE